MALAGIDDGDMDISPPIHVINLSDAPGEHSAWDRPRLVIYLWAICELLIVTNPWQISSSLRVGALRLFGATIGTNVTFRPKTRVKFPWKLEIGNGSWIGEGVWFHNQSNIRIGHDVVVSQETFLTTGTHAHRRDMALLSRPISVHNGAWITSRCIILGGAEIGVSALIKPGTVVSGIVPANTIWGSQAEPGPLGERFI